MWIEKTNEKTLLVVYELEREIFQDQAWSLEMLKKEMDNPISSILILKNKEKSLGYLIARIYLDEAEILRIGIKPDYQRKGLGKFLLENFLEQILSKGINKIYLEVSSQNRRAHLFYQNLGFTKVGLRRDYYRQGEHAIVMKFERACLGSQNPSQRKC